MDLPACADPTPPADGNDEQKRQPSVVEFEVPNVVAEGEGASNSNADPEGCRRIIQPPMIQVFKGNRNARCAMCALTTNKRSQRLH